MLKEGCSKEEGEQVPLAKTNVDGSDPNSGDPEVVAKAPTVPAMAPVVQPLAAIPITTPAPQAQQPDDDGESRVVARKTQDKGKRVMRPEK